MLPLARLNRMGTHPRILLTGYYGLGNCGDEAVLGGLLATIGRQLPNASPVVLSANPQQTQALHGVSAVHRVTGLLPALARAEALVAGGGSLLQDATSFRSLAFYLWTMRAALAFRKKLVLLGQGVGPLLRPRSRALTAAVLNRAHAITLRDAASACLLQELGVTRPRIEVCADLALMLEPCPPPPEVSDFGVVLALRRWRESEPVGAAARAAALCKGIAGACGAGVALLAMQEPDDRTLAEAAAGLVPGVRVLPRLAFAQVAGAVMRARAVVAMRLHALIFAAVAGVPSVALSYDPKVAAFMEAVSRPGWVLPYDASAQQVADAACRALSDVQPYPPGRIDDLRRLARRNVEVLQEVLEGHTP